MKKIFYIVLFLIIIPKAYSHDLIDSYIKKYEFLAKSESKLFGIPYEVILAQGILESASGTSDLAIKAKNHFGMKEKDKNSINFYLHPKEGKFKIFSSVWESYRAHSLLIKEYYEVKKPKLKNYKDWCYFIASCGYAEDKMYATKLIKIIRKKIKAD